MSQPRSSKTPWDARPWPCSASSTPPAPAPATSSRPSPTLLTSTRTPGSSPASQVSARSPAPGCRRDRRRPVPLRRRQGTEGLRRGRAGYPRLRQEQRRAAPPGQEPAPRRRRLPVGVRALTASPGARTHYDRRRHTGDRHAAAQRNLFSRPPGLPAPLPHHRPGRRRGHRLPRIPPSPSRPRLTRPAPSRPRARNPVAGRPRDHPMPGLQRHFAAGGEGRPTAARPAARPPSAAGTRTRPPPSSSAPPGPAASTPSTNAPSCGQRRAGRAALRRLRRLRPPDREPRPMPARQGLVTLGDLLEQEP